MESNPNRKYFGNERRYFIENGIAFYDLGHSAPEKLAADGASFRAYDVTTFGYQYAMRYAADKNGFFVDKEFVPALHANLAEIVFPRNNGNSAALIKLNSNLYMININEKRIEKIKTDADVSNFEAIKPGAPTREARYFQDGKSIFYLAPYSATLTKLPITDISKIRVTPNSESGETPTVLSETQVFIGAHLLNGADPKTFEVRYNGYAVDSQKVFFLGSDSRPGFVISGADRETFQEVDAEDNSFDAMDRHQRYRHGRPVSGR